MRAVALGSKRNQTFIQNNFVPLKIVMTAKPDAKDKSFPLDWQSLASWSLAWSLMKGNGFTGVAVVNPDTKITYSRTGSAMVWEIFHSSAYDEEKFHQMLQNGKTRFDEELAATAKENSKLGKLGALMKHRLSVRKQVNQETSMITPPKGFSIEKAKELFRMTGDLK